MKTLNRVSIFAVTLSLLVAGCGGGGGSSSDPLKVGLIHEWKFDGSGTDSSGNLSTTPIGPVSYIDTGKGQAIVFNGTTTGINLPPAPELQFQKSFSISAWASLYSYPTNSQIWATIIFDGDERNGLDPWDLQVAPDGTFQFLVTSSTQASGLNAPDPFPLNTFVFVTATYDQVKGIQTLYMNGKQVSQFSNVPGLTPVVPLDPTQLPGIGIGTNNGFPNSGYDMGWNGAIKDLRIYDRALGANEVQALYNRG